MTRTGAWSSRPARSAGARSCAASASSTYVDDDGRDGRRSARCASRAPRRSGWAAGGVRRPRRRSPSGRAGAARRALRERIARARRDGRPAAPSRREPEAAADAADAARGLQRERARCARSPGLRALARRAARLRAPERTTAAAMLIIVAWELSWYRWSVRAASERQARLAKGNDDLRAAGRGPRTGTRPPPRTAP